jgi:hypothetical protein
MSIQKTRRWWLGLIAVACACLTMGSGFMACGGDDTATGDAMGSGGTGNAGGSGACDLALCPDPPFTGLEKCCTTDGMCGVKSAGMNTCFPGQSGAGGGGGMGGGKL